MQQSVILRENHTVPHWGIDGIDILYPERRVDDEMRGGMPMCAPMFGVQQRPVAGCELPIHGILMCDESGELKRDGDTQTVTTKYKATEHFAWDFVAVTTVTTNGNTLTHTCTITRAVHCTNPNEMPLSLGLHPYFNTFGEDFSYIINDIKMAKYALSENIIDSDFATLTEGESATLETAKSIVTITPSGYDEYCIWTDDIDKYICIEPIYQYHEFGLPHTGLSAGESKEVSCQFQSLLPIQHRRQTCADTYKQ